MKIESMETQEDVDEFINELNAPLNPKQTRNEKIVLALIKGMR
jgi:hypothetical protein